MKVWVLMVLFGDVNPLVRIVGIYKTKRDDEFMSRIGFEYSERGKISKVIQEEFEVED